MSAMYVLIIIIQTRAITTQEFNNKESCEVARELIKAEDKSFSTVLNPILICTPK